MSGFTKGPWAAGWNGGKTGPTCPSASPTVAGREWHYMPVGVGQETVAIVVQQDRQGDYFANAHLIAAAPELYHTVEMLTDALESLVGECPEVEKGRAALAKAEGKS